jgi:NADPH-dependent 2,4-dienoyl-CoA reductase/sulfur reductase-like enzyme
MWPRWTSLKPHGSWAVVQACARRRILNVSATVAIGLGAAMGATRVITDRGWIHHDRQIGTTGVIVDPDLYVAWGISGAVQHTAGLGHPTHIISINTDPHCPMMQLADLGIVSDAAEVLRMSRWLERLDVIRMSDSPMSDSPMFDVVVVGAGPAGSCAATVLARRGHSVLLIETGAVPGQQEHVRRRGVPAHP